MRHDLQRWRYIVGAALTAYSLGCAIGITSPSLKLLKIDTEYVQHSRELYAASLNLGVVIGALLVPIFLFNADGRETLALSCFPSIAGWAFSSAATGSFQTDARADIHLLYMGRFLLGIGGGLSMVHCPGFLNDSPFSKDLSSLYQITMVLGMFLQQLLCAVLPINTIFIINAVACSGILLGLFQTSPPAYPENSQITEVKHVTDETFVSASTVEKLPETKPLIDSRMSSSSSKSRTSSSSLSEPLPINTTLVSMEADATPNRDQKMHQNSFLFTAYVAASQQLCGLNAINFYLIQLFQRDGRATTSLTNPTMYAIITTFAQFAVTLLGGICLYKRAHDSTRFNMATSCTGALLALVAMTTILWARLDSFYLMIATVVFQISFSFGLGPTTWTIIAKSSAVSCPGDTLNEKFTRQTKSTSCAAVVNQLASFIVVFSFYPLVGLIGMHGLFLMYSIFTFLYLVLIVLLL